MERGDRLLIVDGDAELGRRLCDLANTMGLLAIVFDDGDRVVDLAADQQPDLILLDLALPRADGRDLLRALKAHPRTFHIPVFVQAGVTAPTDRLAILELGADDYFEKPVDPTILVRRIKNRLRKLHSAGESGPPSEVDRRSSERLRVERQIRQSQGRILVDRRHQAVLVVEDDQDVRQCICEILEDEGFEAWPARNGREALDLLRKHALRPSLILLDLAMPVLDGREFHARLSRDATLPTTRVVLMSDVAPDATLALLPWLRKPIDLAALLAAVAEAPE